MRFARKERSRPLLATDVADDARLALRAPDDRDAFVTLYERHVGAVYRYCLSRLGERQLAEDAPSEVFLKALEHIGSFRGGTFAAWLIVIARNTVIDRLRRHKPVVGLERLPEPVDHSPGPEDRAVAASERMALRGAVERLSEDQRAVIELQLAGWRGSEIAEALGKSQSAVKMLRLRAVRRLRALLANDDGRGGKELPDA